MSARSKSNMRKGKNSMITAIDHFQSPTMLITKGAAGCYFVTRTGMPVEMMGKEDALRLANQHLERNVACLTFRSKSVFGVYSPVNANARKLCRAMDRGYLNAEMLDTLKAINYIRVEVVA